MTWSEKCALSNAAGDSTFKITDAKLYVPVLTLSTEGNAKLSQLLTEGLKRPFKKVYWHEYKVIPEQRYNANDNIRKLIDPSYANSIVNSHRKYFLPKVEIKKSQHWNWWKKFLWSTN